MKIRSAPGNFELPHPASPAPEFEVKQRPGEMRRVVKRLEALIVPHLETAKKMDRLLGAADLRAVIAALQAEADGLSPVPHLDCPDEILRYLRETLYLELVAEPSNVFYTTAVSEDVVRYEPMPRSFWKECLSELHKRLHLEERTSP